MAKCRHYVNGCGACNGGIYKSQSPVRLNKRETAYNIKDPMIIRQFCNTNPYDCPYNPDGKGYASQKTKKIITERAFQKDHAEINNPNHAKYTFISLAVIGLILYFIFK